MVHQGAIADDEVFDLASLALFLKVSERTVKEWDRNGDGPPRARTPGRSRRWLKSEVIAWLKGGRVAPPSGSLRGGATA